MEITSLIGLLLVLAVFYKFVNRLGHAIPILELMLLLAGLQWIVGPLIEYISPSNHFKYYMYVPEEVYMAFVVPAYFVFVLAVLTPISKYSKYFISLDIFYNQTKFAIVLLLIGIASDFIGPYVPDSLKFFLYLSSNFKYAAAIILYFSENEKLRNVFYLVILYLFYNSLRFAMFHDFVLWSLVFYMFWAIKFKPSIKTILLTFLIGIVFLTSLQSVKAVYRSQVWGGYAGNKIELFFGLVIDSIFSEGLLSEVSEGQTGNNVRLNQGWIISAIMSHVPEEQPFFEGETIEDAVSASLLPRFLSPNKTTAGGRENFRRFTGLDIGEGTSMGISIIGEAYGNYNVIGGMVFMGIWGLFLGRIWLSLLKYGFENVLFLAFLPLIFLQVIKAETELVVVLNHLLKSLIVVFAFFYVAKRKLVQKLHYV